QTDRNLWSSLDDGDNLGGALQLQARFKPKSIRLRGMQLGEVQVQGLLREKGNRFFEISRDQEVEYNRKWDLPGIVVERGECVKEFGFTYRPFQGGQVLLDGGDFRQGEGFQSNRWLGEFMLRRPKFPDIRYREEQIERSDGKTEVNGDWVRRLGQARYQIWRFRPHFRYEGENKKDRAFSDSLRTGFTFDDITAGLAFQVAKPLEISFAQTVREDQRVTDGTMQDYSRAVSRTFRASLSRWRNLQMSFEVTNRTREFEQEDLPEKRTRLADIFLNYSPWKQALRTDVRVRLSSTQISKTEQFFFAVEEGRGNFRFDSDLNEFVPDEFGDHVLRTLATGEFEPVNDLLMNAKLSIKPRLAWGNKKQQGLKKLLGSITWATFFSFDEKSRRENPWEIFFGGIGAIFPDEETVFGRYLIRQDLYLFENIHTRSLRVRWSERLEKNNRLTAGGQQSSRQELSLRFTSRINRKFSIESSFARNKIERVFASAARVDRRILSRGGNIRLSYRPKSALEISSDLKVLVDLDRAHRPSTETVLFGVKPGLSYSLRGKGRLRGELEYSRVNANPSSRIIPYEMAEGRRVGRNLRWQLGLDYRVSSRVMILFSYIGRNLPGRDGLQHLGKAEVKAFF
ncbi:MAG: hypothetical protein V3U73_00885, partial [bacterium]